MASHSGRPGAIRKKGTKKGAQVGTGGHSRRRLEGKGPTPKAEDRTYHPAHKRKVKREAREAQEAAIARAPAAPIQPKTRTLVSVHEKTRRHHGLTQRAPRRHP